MKYPYSAIPFRGALKWPNDARIALLMTLNLEYWDLIKETDAPYYAGGPPILPDLLPGNTPDFPNYTWRDYGPRVGIWRLIDIFDELGAPASCTFNAKTALERPVLVEAATSRGKAEIEDSYGRISTASTGAILRKVVELEQQGADKFFGEKSFEVSDLVRKTKGGKGVISVIRLTDLQDRPKLFSTFMLCLLAEVYSTFEEQGDAEKPKLVIFIDEAHLMFDRASRALLDQIETIIKLIRSKGVGIYFCTQTPRDIPDAVLGQLGLKVQHALRAFTAKDRKAIKLASENYPTSEFYNTSQLITELGIGEALISALNEKGRPTPLAATLLRAPMSRMDVLTRSEIMDVIETSNLFDKYNERVDRQSAHEILTGKIEHKKKEQELLKQQKLRQKAGRGRRKSQSIMDSTVTRQIGRTVARELARGLLGVLGIGGATRRRTKSYRGKGWF